MCVCVYEKKLSHSNNLLFSSAILKTSSITIPNIMFDVTKMYICV